MAHDPLANGGPAFPLENPRQLEDGALFKQFPGMSLRDWFAGQALAGFIACHAADADAAPSASGAARAAYQYADAMLAERSKSEER